MSLAHDHRIEILTPAALAVSAWTDQLESLLDNTTQLPDGRLGVHWTLANAQKLALAGFDPPSPLRHTHKWHVQPFAHQIRTAEFISVHRRCGVWSAQGCVDSETEYLSPQGWVRIADYSGGDVAQYRPETGAVEFVPPEEFVKLPCPEMIRVRTKYGLDQLLSPEHRVLLQRYDGSRHEVVSAETLMGRHDAWQNKVPLVRGAQPIPFAVAAIPTTFSAPGGGGLPLTDAQIRLQVAIIADGHFADLNLHRCVIRLKRPRKITRMRSLLSAAGVEYRERADTSPTGAGFAVFSFAAPRREKEFGAEWWGATAAQRAIVADEVLHWDGSVIGGKRSFSTTSKPTLDFVQYVFTTQGCTATPATHDRREAGHKSIEYSLTISDRKSVGIRSGYGVPSVWREPSTDGFKYCFRVPSTFLVFRRNGRIFASGNTGKTLSAIAACDYLLSRGTVRRVLILCPLSVMRVAWCADMNNFAPHRRITVAHGTKDKRIAAIDAESEFVVMNFDGIKLMESHLKGKFDMIVADEANAFKNFRSDRSKVLRRLLTKDTRLVLMTGTPASQSPEDAYGLAKLLDNPQCPAYFSTWQAAVMTQITQFKWRAKPDAPQRVAEILKPSIRFRKEDCLDLPEQMYVDRATEMGVEQKKVYEQLRKEALIALGSGDKLTAANAGAMLNKLLQISSGAVKTSDGGVLEVECKDRFNDLVDIVTGTTRKFIIFANYRAPIAMLHRMLRELHIETATITGDTPMNVRSTLFNAFQIEHSPLRGLVIQPAAAAHGVTLTAADTVVWWGPPASVELYKQANDRPHRIGQKNPVTIFHLSSSPAEAKMYKLLRQNIAVHEKIVDLFGEIARD